MPPNHNSKQANVLGVIQKNSMRDGKTTQPPSQLQTDDGLTDFLLFFPDFHPAKFDEPKESSRNAVEDPTNKSNVKQIGNMNIMETREKKKDHSNKRAKPTKKKFTKEELEEIENQIEEIMKPPTISEKCLHENRCALLEKYNLNFFQFPPDYIREVVQDVKEKHKNKG
ncbi:unnamed protein product [Caenorhabditis nigoni]